jgi:hypothetical protein
VGLAWFFGGRRVYLVRLCMGWEGESFVLRCRWDQGLRGQGLG